MAQTIKTRRRGQGTSALAFMNRGFNSGASEVYKNTSKRGEKRVYEPKQWPTPTQDDLDLALRDVAEMGWRCATEWSQYVIDWFERR